MKIKNKISIAHIALLVIGSAFLLNGALYGSVWFDEAYSVGAASQNIIDMCEYISFDVHPHLYYIILNIWSSLTGGGIIAMRLFSVLCACLLALLGFTHIRRDFGEKVGFWFTFLVFTCHATFRFASQIRMYTLAPLLVGLAAIYAYRRLTDDSKKNRILFLTLSLLASYTHYFAFFTMAAINAFFLVRAVRNKQEPSLMRVFKRDAVIQFGAYLPGIAIFLLQTFKNGASWIEIIYPDFIFDSLGHPFIGVGVSDVTEKGGVLYYLIIVLLATAYLLYGFRLFKLYKRDKANTYPAALAIWVCIAVIAFGLAVSVFRPIYYMRYTMIFYPLFLFSVAFVISRINSAAVKGIIASLLVCCLVVVTVPYYEECYSSENDNAHELIESNLQDGDVFAFNDCWSYVITVFYQDTPVYYLNAAGWGVQKTFMAFNKRCEIVEDLTCLDSFIGRIWVINGGQTYDYLMSFENSRVLLDKQGHMPYQDQKYTVTLIEKNSEKVKVN